MLDDFVTLSGFLCHLAGEIPAAGASIPSDAPPEGMLAPRAVKSAIAGKIRFDVLEADERKIVSVRATNLTGRFTAPARRDEGDAAAATADDAAAADSSRDSSTLAGSAPGSG